MAIVAVNTLVCEVPLQLSHELISKFGLQLHQQKHSRTES